MWSCQGTRGETVVTRCDDIARVALSGSRPGRVDSRWLAAQAGRGGARLLIRVELAIHVVSSRLYGGRAQVGAVRRCVQGTCRARIRCRARAGAVREQVPCAGAVRAFARGKAVPATPTCKVCVRLAFSGT